MFIESLHSFIRETAQFLVLMMAPLIIMPDFQCPPRSQRPKHTSPGFPLSVWKLPTFSSIHFPLGFIRRLSWRHRSLPSGSDSLRASYWEFPASWCTFCQLNHIEYVVNNSWWQLRHLQFPTHIQPTHCTKFGYFKVFFTASWNEREANCSKWKQQEQYLTYM